MGRIATFGNGDADIPIGPAYCEVCVDKDVAAGVTQDDASWAATLAHFEKAKKDPPDRDLTILVKKPAGFHAAIHHG